MTFSARTAPSRPRERRHRPTPLPWPDISSCAEHLLAGLWLRPASVAIPGRPRCRNRRACDGVLPRGLHTLNLVLEEPALRIPFDTLPHGRLSESHRLGWLLPGNLAPDWPGTAFLDASRPPRTSKALERSVPARCAAWSESPLHQTRLQADSKRPVLEPCTGRNTGCRFSPRTLS